jgi:hypothetical protein
MATLDKWSDRFRSLLESGMSMEDAWRILSGEILSSTGVVEPRHLEPSEPPPEGVATGRIPIYESKTLKVVRIEPEDDDRIRALLGRMKQASAGTRSDAPTESAIIRRALRLGLDELERQERQNARRPTD